MLYELLGHFDRTLQMSVSEAKVRAGLLWYIL